MKKTVIIVAVTVVATLALRNILLKLPLVSKIPAIGSAPSA